MRSKECKHFPRVFFAMLHTLLASNVILIIYLIYPPYKIQCIYYIYFCVGYFTTFYTL
jgi:hypothetical protein